MWFEYRDDFDVSVVKADFGMLLFEFDNHFAGIKTVGGAHVGFFFSRIYEPGPRKDLAGLVTSVNLFCDPETLALGQVSINDDGYKNFPEPGSEDHERYEYDVATSVAPFLASISFFHCSNVKIVTQHPERKLSEVFKKKHGQPLRSFRLIEVHKRTTRKAPNEPKSEGNAMSAHIVRGHFKKSEGNKGLFGRIHGLWFWESHVRGEGVPENPNYRTWPPDGSHKRSCLVRT